MRILRIQQKRENTNLFRNRTDCVSKYFRNFAPIIISEKNERQNFGGQLHIEPASEAQQNTQPAQNGSAPAANGSEAEQLKRLKDLLDAGVLTQEEFDAKKKQVLGL